MDKDKRPCQLCGHVQWVELPAGTRYCGWCHRPEQRSGKDVRLMNERKAARKGYLYGCC